MARCGLPANHTAEICLLFSFEIRVVISKSTRISLIASIYRHCACTGVMFYLPPLCFQLFPLPMLGTISFIITLTAITVVQHRAVSILYGLVV